MIGAFTPTPQMTEDNARQLAGMQPMDGMELDRFQRRQDQEGFRQEQMGGIQQGLEGQAGMADEIAGSLRRAGLSDVAERYRRASQQQAFNAARRGLTGGSYDIEGRADLGAQAQMGGQEAVAGAEQARIDMLLQQMQEAGGMQEQLMGMSPFEQQMMSQENWLAQMQAQQAEREQGIQQQIAAANARRRGALGSAIGGTIGSLGNVAAMGLMGSA